MIEEGSAYSSDYEQVDKSEYVSTDGEGNQNEEAIDSNIMVLRGITLKPDLNKAAKTKSMSSSLHATGEFGGLTKKQTTTPSDATEVQSSQAE